MTCWALWMVLTLAHHQFSLMLMGRILQILPMKFGSRKTNIRLGGSEWPFLSQYFYHIWLEYILPSLACYSHLVCIQIQVKSLSFEEAIAVSSHGLQELYWISSICQIPSRPTFSHRQALGRWVEMRWGGRTNHQALYCFHRMDYSFQGRHPPSQLHALVAQTDHELENQQWYAHNGANAHITNQYDNLTLQQPFQSSEIV